jgi:molecular chaperone GrpE
MNKEKAAAAADASASQEDLKKKLEECEKKAAEYLAGWQRERADFLNYKKEEMERIGELLKYANEEFILRILPILDNFNVAEKKLPENLKKDENPEGEPAVPYGAGIKGFLHIKRQLESLLKNQGLEEIKSLGEKFNPNFHEIIGEVSPSEASAKEGKNIEPGIIVEEIQKGYKINGRLLRPAKVKVTK